MAHGLDLFLPTDRRNATVSELHKRGYAEQMFLSHDFGIPIADGLDWYPPESLRQFRSGGALTVETVFVSGGRRGLEMERTRGR
jgi:predicted metal-dependent phosphotriesterase family hydrolase